MGIPKEQKKTRGPRKKREPQAPTRRSSRATHEAGQYNENRQYRDAVQQVREEQRLEAQRRREDRHSQPAALLGRLLDAGGVRGRGHSSLHRCGARASVAMAERRSRLRERAAHLIHSWRSEETLLKAEVERQGGGPM